MVFQGISIWRIVGIRSDQEVIVDLLLADSAYLQTALARTRTVPFGSLPVPILTLEDLIILKTLAGRLQDRADLEKIRARQADLHVDGLMSTSGKRRSDLLTIRLGSTAG